jgi:NitT/TauT family transport system permease protein/taurine transport system permease protein
MHPTLAKLPTIGQVWSALGEMISNGELGEDIRASLIRYVLGIVVGVASGLILGVLAGRLRPVALLLEPLATFFTAVSGIAWIPLAILWFGIGTGTVVFVIWNTVFFLVFANTLLGVRSNKVVLEEAVRTLGGGPLHVVRSVIFPGALPHILVGVRAGLGFGWRALIAAEIIGSSQGLGAMIFTARESYRTDIIVAGIIVVALLSVITELLIFMPLQRRTVERWGMLQAGGRR